MTMNNDRRKSLNALWKQIEAFKDTDLPKLAEIMSRAEELKSAIETIRDEEQEYYDNMPAGPQSGEKGEAASNVISELDEALTGFEWVITVDDDVDLDTVLEHVDNASA